MISCKCGMLHVLIKLFPRKSWTTRKNKNDHQNQYVRIPKVLKKYDQHFWHLYIIISPISNLSCLLCKVFGVSRNFLINLLFCFIEHINLPLYSKGCKPTFICGYLISWFTKVFDMHWFLATGPSLWQKMWRE